MTTPPIKNPYVARYWDGTTKRIMAAHEAQVYAVLKSIGALNGLKSVGRM